MSIYKFDNQISTDQGFKSAYLRITKGKPEVTAFPMLATNFGIENICRKAGSAIAPGRAVFEHDELGQPGAMIKRQRSVSVAAKILDQLGGTRGDNRPARFITIDDIRVVKDNTAVAIRQCLPHGGDFSCFIDAHYKVFATSKSQIIRFFWLPHEGRAYRVYRTTVFSFDASSLRDAIESYEQDYINLGGVA